MIPMIARTPARILSVWLPNWPCQRVHQLLQPQPTTPEPAPTPTAQTQPVQAPLVLSARDSRRGLIVAAACRLARSLGIRPQMSLSEAIGLSQRATRVPPNTSTSTPTQTNFELQIVEHDPQEDLEKLCQLAEEAQRFSPIVGLEPLGSKPWAGIALFQTQGLMLDIRGIGPLFCVEIS